MVCTAFRGLDRRPGASNRSYNKSWNWGWHDERNLSSDRYPRLSVRKNRSNPSDVDGTTPAGKILAMCSGEHLVIYDDTGKLWCNGHSQTMDMATSLMYHWSITGTTSGLEGNPATGETANIFDLGGLGTIDSATHTLVGEPGPAMTADCVEWAVDGNVNTNQDYEYRHYSDEHGISWDEWTLTRYGITIRTNHFEPGGSMTGTITTYATPVLTGPAPRMVRMGACVYLIPSPDGNGVPMFCNVVKLAAGDTLTPGEDYGYLDFSYSTSVQAMVEHISVTVCDIDGNALSPIDVGASEPADTTHFWLDTSGTQTTVRIWSASSTTWVSMPSTYLKISPTPLTDLNGAKLKVGDAIKFAATPYSISEEQWALDLFNSTHYIIAIDEANQAIVIPGIIPDDSYSTRLFWSLSRTIPKMDFVVEAQNRLWGCYYGKGENGEILNEIYASKLGDPTNWQVFQGLSTDSWTASRGTAAPFTGAVSLSGNPIFFREESLEKVFPSSSGAHQIATYSLDGVQAGSANSVTVIDERVFYKSRMGVCVYAGTLPARISEEFDDWQFSEATAARHERKYACCMTRSDGVRLCMVYDLDTGDWHVEDEVWDGMAVTWADELYYVKDGVLFRMDGQDNSAGVEWYAESDEMSLELPEHKWIRCLRFRYQMELGASCRAYISYDGGPWERKADLHGNRLHSAEAEIWPRRCDHFRLRLEGNGGFELQSISYRVERSQGGR